MSLQSSRDNVPCRTKQKRTPSPPRRMADDYSDADDNSATPAASTIPPSWKCLPTMSAKRINAGGLFVNNHQFLVMGGRIPGDYYSNYLSSCEYYDAKTKTWNLLSIKLPTPLACFGVACINNQLFVLGGDDDTESICNSDLFSMDLSGSDLSTLGAQNWEPLAPMNQGRSKFACVSHQQFIYVFGGWGAEGDKILDTVERYDTKTNQWTSLPPMPGGARAECAAGVVGNRIFVVGGEDEDETTLTSSIVFDTSKQEWESSTISSTTNNPNDKVSYSTPLVPNMKTPRSDLSVVVEGQFVIAICGEHSKTIEVLDTQQNDWNLSPTPMEKTHCSFVTGFCKETNEIIVAGGYARGTPMDYHWDTIMKDAWSIPFESGILPVAFQIKERRQKVEDVINRGQDS